MSVENTLELINKGVLEGDQEAVVVQVWAALDAGLAAEKILEDGLIHAMREVGRLFEAGEYYVPEMLVAARAMQAGLKVIKPLLAETGVRAAGRVLIGTASGDLHDIGKNLVGMMLEGAGFEVIDLGVDVQPGVFVTAVRKHKPDIVALSALLTTTMPNMTVTIQELEKAGLRKQVKVMVGGAPITEEFAHKIGADGFGRDASQAVRVAKALIG